MFLLIDYIKEVLPGFNRSIFLEYACGSYFSQIQFIISNVKLEKLEAESNRIPAVLISKSEICYFNEFIDLILEYTIEKKIDNVLNIGYTDGSTLDSTNKFVFKGYNSSIDFLKSKPMEIIKNVIGAELFINLIWNFNAIWIPSNTIIWGEYKSKSYKTTRKKPCITLKYMLYQHKSRLRRTNPVIEDPKGLFNYIFCFEKQSKNIIKYNPSKKFEPPKRFRKIYKLLKKLILNHKSHFKEYPYIVDQICSQKELNFNDNLSLCVEKGKVIKFIMTIIYMIIPMECFGTSKNRTIIMRNIPKLINGTILSKINMEDAIKNVKINEILWLKPRNNIPMTKHEFIKAKKMFSSFISWLFHFFICRIIAAFFYVTQASQKNRLLFYRHHIWSKITKKYLSTYITKHLINKKDSINNFNKLSTNKDYIGNLSLQPKKSSFRLIVKPFKGNKNENIEYMFYQKRKLKPMMQILQKIRMRNSCSSVSDIIHKIYKFKGNILEKNEGKLPKIYSYKFDAQNAYDSLPHDTIRQLISERLDLFTNKNNIFLQLYSEMDKVGQLWKKKWIIADDVSKFSLMIRKKYHHNSKYLVRRKKLVDNHETFKFSKSEILDFVIKQYKNTCFHTNTRSYYRKIGVFQGFPMSALIFNIVYDSLVEELYSMIGDSTNTIIIRLMDDFLILSTQREHIKILRKLTARCIKKYNLQINRVKTTFSTTDLNFAGINIDIEKLICYKKLEDYNNSPIDTTSFNQIYKRLLRYTKMRLKNTELFCILPNKSGKNGCRQNVTYLVKATLFKFGNSYKLIKTKNSFSVSSFYQFITQLYFILNEKIPLAEINFSFSLLWSYSMNLLKTKRIQ